MWHWVCWQREAPSGTPDGQNLVLPTTTQRAMASHTTPPEDCRPLLARLQAGLAQHNPGPAALRQLLANTDALLAAVDQTSQRGR